MARTLDELPAESKAVLSLVLVLGRSYEQIASLLRVSTDDIRGRAQRAADAVVGDAAEQPSVEARQRIVDYMLGQQPVSGRRVTRSELAGDPVARAWAQQLYDGLAPLTKTHLPAIPPENPAAVAPPVDGAPAAVNGRESPPTKPKTVSLRRQVVPPPRWRPSPPSISHARLLAWIAVVVVAIVVLVLAITSGGQTDRTKETQSASTASRASPPLSRIVLTAAGAQRKAAGSASLVRQEGELLLLMKAHGLTPNRHNDYAVWLFNGPTDARLLGFVAPAVGRNRRFSSGVSLPSNAFHFHSLIITLEASAEPTKPGQLVLRGAFSRP
jgi:hypothetical protein